MREDLKGFAGFFWQNWQQAAAFCATNKVNLAEGLKWAERAVSDPTWSGGQENFTTLSTLSLLQGANGLTAESAKTFDKALNHPTAQPVQIHMAGRQLLTAGKKEEALKVFQLNAKRFPNQWPVHVGLMRGYAAMGDKKKALAEAKLALAQAPGRGQQEEPANQHQAARGGQGHQLGGSRRAAGMLAARAGGSDAAAPVDPCPLVDRHFGRGLRRSSRLLRSAAAEIHRDVRSGQEPLAARWPRCSCSSRPTRPRSRGSRSATRA